jgi:hypothetical protein
MVPKMKKNLLTKCRGSTDANCQDTPTQHKFNTVPHSHQSPEISSEQHEANKNHNSQETEGNMGSKKTAWTVSTEPE